MERVVDATCLGVDTIMKNSRKSEAPIDLVKMVDDIQTTLACDETWCG